jgi:hypothetical protein
MELPRNGQHNSKAAEHEEDSIPSLNRETYVLERCRHRKFKFSNFPEEESKRAEYERTVVFL